MQLIVYIEIFTVTSDNIYINCAYVVDTFATCKDL